MVVYNILIAGSIFVIGIVVGSFIHSLLSSKEKAFGIIRILYDSENNPYARLTFPDDNGEDLLNKEYAVFKIVK